MARNIKRLSVKAAQKKASVGMKFTQPVIPRDGRKGTLGVGNKLVITGNPNQFRGFQWYEPNDER